MSNGGLLYYDFQAETSGWLLKSLLAGVGARCSSRTACYYITMVSSQLIPIPTRTLPSHTQANSYPIPGRTLTNSYLLPTRTQTISYPVPTHTQAT